MKTDPSSSRQNPRSNSGRLRLSPPGSPVGAPRLTRAGAAWVATAAPLLLLVMLIIFMMSAAATVVFSRSGSGTRWRALGTSR